MNASVITALAALAGAAIGGLTSVFASWLAQHAQARAQWAAQDKLRRQELYKEFIEAASKCYVDALQHDEADIPALIELYVRVGRMRILSSPKVVESAERVTRTVVDSYLVPNKTFFAISARPAARSSSRFAVNSEGSLTLCADSKVVTHQNVKSAANARFGSKHW
jgi:hypothetical protein